MHVILRYEIEKGLINGDIAVMDVPAIWNKKMLQYLQVSPKSDADGCLQDVHWSSGAFGYFPTYSLGENFRTKEFYEILFSNLHYIPCRSYVCRSDLQLHEIAHS